MGRMFSVVVASMLTPSGQSRGRLTVSILVVILTKMLKA